MSAAVDSVQCDVLSHIPADLSEQPVRRCPGRALHSLQAAVRPRIRPPGAAAVRQAPARRPSRLRAQAEGRPAELRFVSDAAAAHPTGVVIDQRRQTSKLIRTSSLMNEPRWGDS